MGGCNMKKWKKDKVVQRDSMIMQNYKQLESRMYEVMATVNKSIKAEELKEYLESLASAEISIEKAGVDELKRISFSAIKMAKTIITSLLELKNSIGAIDGK